MDRTKKPFTKATFSLPDITPKTFTLGNDKSIFYLDETKEDVVSMIFMYPAGNWYEPKRLVSGFLADILIEGGTKKYSAKEFIEEVNYHGISISCSNDKDVFYITVKLRPDKLTEALHLLEEMIFYPRFDENELQKLVSESIESYNRLIATPSWHSKKLFLQAAFGNNHPYGYFQSVKDFKAITVEDLKQFHAKTIFSTMPIVEVVGNITQKHLEQIGALFNNHQLKKSSFDQGDLVTETSNKKAIILEEKEGALQSSLHIFSMIPIDYSHKDYFSLILTNFIFGGGFFNARLMQNIREDKGYTYGMYSTLTNYHHAYFIDISGEVIAKHTKDVLEEVWNEMKDLQEKPVSNEMITMLQEIIKTRFALKLDGKYKQLDYFTKKLVEGKNANEYLTRYMDAINSLTPEVITKMAQTYLVPENFQSVIVGKY